MLYEVTRVQQVPGEPHRRWFFSHEQDLLMWFGEDSKPVAFQLSYNKHRKEHAIRWKAERGFSHYSVDDGEGGADRRDAPILLEGGIFPAVHVLWRFVGLSGEMPREITEFVSARLREHPHYRAGMSRFHSRAAGIASGVAIGLAIVAVGLLAAQFLGRSRRRNQLPGSGEMRNGED